MVDTNTSTTNAQISRAQLSRTESRPAGSGAGDRDASHAKPAGKPTAAPHIAAQTLDELLAKEALANLKRARAAAHAEADKTRPRINIPPAKLVVRPQTLQSWKRPFVSLALVVGLSTGLYAAGFAYLMVQPFSPAAQSEAEIRTLRDGVAQLRRDLAELSSDVAAGRTTLTAANQAATDRLDRFARMLVRIERERPTLAEQPQRAAADGAAIAPPARAASPSDVTGSIAPPSPSASPRPDIVAGWRVRRAYHGVAVLESQSGVVEVVLGQKVPELGRILDIRSDDGHWQVMTTKGLIESGR
ncbi:hypothetical protein ACTZWT_17715 [Rhodopseudomonas sp. NSM]|uniref:hypothetical protein n=1 Tax=Rhodopseudomonas sp. NSM TaxID=3457630 RepID=UPI004035AB37